MNLPTNRKKASGTQGLDNGYEIVRARPARAPQTVRLTMKGRQLNETTAKVTLYPIE